MFNITVTEAKTAADAQDLVNTAKYGQWKGTYDDKEGQYFEEDDKFMAGCAQSASIFSHSIARLNFDEEKASGHRLFIARENDVVVGCTMLNKDQQPSLAVISPLVDPANVKQLSEKMRSEINKTIKIQPLVQADRRYFRDLLGFEFKLV